MIPQDGVTLHQVEFRWQPGLDVSLAAHSGLGPRDLDALDSNLGPLARAPQGAPVSTSIVHKAFPAGLGSERQPLGVILLRRYDPASVTGDEPGGVARNGLSARALIVPDVDQAGRAAIGLALADLPALQLGGRSRSGDLPTINRNIVDHLLSVESDLSPDYSAHRGTWDLLLAAIRRFLASTEPRGRVWIEGAPPWAEDLAAGRMTLQLWFLKSLFGALRGGLSGLPELAKPWDGSFTTFEYLAESQSPHGLPQLIFEPPRSERSRPRAGQLSLQNALHHLPDDDQQHLAALLVKQAVLRPESLWRPDAGWRSEAWYRDIVRGLEASLPTEATDRTEATEGTNAPVAGQSTELDPVDPQQAGSRTRPVRQDGAPPPTAPAPDAPPVSVDDLLALAVKLEALLPLVPQQEKAVEKLTGAAHKLVHHADHLAATVSCTTTGADATDPDRMRGVAGIDIAAAPPSGSILVKRWWVYAGTVLLAVDTLVAAYRLIRR